MFNVIRQRSENLEADKGSPLGDVGGGPGIGPGAETDKLAGDEEAFDPGAAVAHHEKMAAFHESHAAPAEGSPDEEAGELPDFEAKEDEGAEELTPAPVTEEPEPPAEAAAETPADEEAEGEFPPKKPSAFNAFRKGGR